VKQAITISHFRKPEKIYVKAKLHYYKNNIKIYRALSNGIPNEFILPVKPMYIYA
jgi:hypothetical protein